MPDTVSYYNFQPIRYYEFTFNYGRTYLGFENGFWINHQVIFLLYPNFRFLIFIGSILLNFSALLRISNTLFRKSNAWFPLLALYVPILSYCILGLSSEQD